jgi:hypothetical protein
MFRKVSSVLFLVVLSLVVALPAFADQPANVGGGLGNKAPDFSAGVYADGQAWGTKGTTTLPAPTDSNAQSYDVIFAFTNGADGQLAVAEASPGNPAYNGGRWTAFSATWVDNPSHAKVVLTSYAQVMEYVGYGDIMIQNVHSYFQCPLLPVK